MSRALPGAAALALAGAVPSAAQPTPRVLLIGIDGVRPDVLAEVPTPNLDALAASGWYTAQARTTTPSVSGPSWSSMLTGVWPEKHGVTNNGFIGRDYDRWPGFLDRVERERPELATFAALDWMPLAELPEGGPVVSAAIDQRATVDGYELGWAEADGEVAAQAARHLAEADPDAMFVYLGNPDETSHRHASIGAEYRAAIALSDRHVGMLIDAVRGRPRVQDEDWLVLVSTDHGRREDGGHGGDSPEEMTIFILASGLGAGGSGRADNPGQADDPGGADDSGRARDPADWPPPGPADIVDVAATALAHLGLAIDPAWGLDGTPLSHLGGAREPGGAAMQVADAARAENLFRAHCGRCHGVQGLGGEGPELARLALPRVADQQQLERIIRFGIPGTGMPGARSTVLDDEAVSLVAGHVRRLGARNVADASDVTGDAGRGHDVFWDAGDCASCHIVAGRGTAVGPELTRIGLRRGADYLREALQAPAAKLPVSRSGARSGFYEYLPVRIVTHDGEVFNGMRLNEDAFTIQLMTVSGALVSLRKRGIAEMEQRLGHSFMPLAQDLDEGDIDDLVAYLTTLGRGS